MDGAELHPLLHDMLYSDESLNFLDFFDAVADWLSLEYPIEAAGMRAVEPRMLRLALEYRTLPQALVGITYQFHLLYDTVMAGSISDEEVFKLGQYLAEHWESVINYNFGGSSERGDAHVLHHRVQERFWGLATLGNELVRL